MTMKRLVALGMLSSLALFLFVAIPAYSQEGDQIVVINPSIGGTSNPGPGTYTYPNGEFVYLTAIPAAGYHFVQWLYLGPQDPSYHHGSMLTFDTATVQFDCAGGYTVEWQAVFAPNA